MEHLTKNLKARRKKLCMTQGELGDKLGVGGTAVCNWETGKSNPTADKLQKLAKIFGCTIDELFGEE